MVQSNLSDFSVMLDDQKDYSPNTCMFTATEIWKNKTKINQTCCILILEDVVFNLIV